LAEGGRAGEWILYVQRLYGGVGIFDSRLLDFLDLPDSLNLPLALQLADAELAIAEQAVIVGNAGRARVCARRAVAAFIQEIAPSLGLDAGTNALANLRFLKDGTGFPDDVRNAAERLLGGARSILADEPYSTDPLADARTIIRYYVDGPL
jgi:hypothetical protein